MSDSQKKLPGQLDLGDIAYYVDKDGKRHLVEVSNIPAGHVLVTIKSKSADSCQRVLMTVPADDLYSLE